MLNHPFQYMYLKKIFSPLHWTASKCMRGLSQTADNAETCRYIFIQFMGLQGPFFIPYESCFPLIVYFALCGSFNYQYTGIILNTKVMPLGLLFLNCIACKSQSCTAERHNHRHSSYIFIKVHYIQRADAKGNVQ